MEHKISCAEDTAAEPQMNVVKDDDEKRRRRSLTYSIADGSAYSVMVGLGDSYISPYAVFLNATNAQIALLTAVPQAIGALFQMIGVTLVDTIKRRRFVSVVGSISQALMWIPIVLAPYLLEEHAATALIVFWAAYVGFVSITLPAWNSWMGDLVKPEDRGRYFGRRNGLASIASFISYVVGGLLLQYFKERNQTATGFCVIFGIAFGARLVSIFYLARVHETPYVLTPRDRFTFREFIRRSPKSNFGRFVIYVALFTFCVNISAPFFAVYMLRVLHFSYTEFMISNGVAVVVTLFTLHSWGKLGDRFGNKKIITLTGALVPIVPVLWTLSKNFYYLLFVQAVAGFAWGGFSLSASNFLFDAVSPPKRARCAGYSGLINGMAIFFGATFGGLIATHMTETVGVGIFSFQFASNLQTIFLLSGVLRLATTVAFRRLFKEVKLVEHISVPRLFFTITQIWPPPSVILRLFTGRETEDRNNGKRNGGPE